MTRRPAGLAARARREAPFPATICTRVQTVGKTVRLLTTSILMLASVSAATAQRALAPGDTMRFQHITISTGEVESPMGPQKVTLEMRMQVAMTGLGGDSAVTWFDSVSVSGPIPGMSEMMDKIRGQRMVTRFRPGGRIEMNGMPQELNLAGFQLSPTALNFGLAMRGKLTRGFSWTDTTNTQRDTLGTSLKMSSITRYQVMGDSVYDGETVTVIGTTIEMVTQSSTGAGAMVMNDKGTGSGHIHFSTTLGIIVSQSTTMQSESNIQVADMSMTSRNRVEQSMRLLRRK